jgi:hypothetical protein
VRQDDQVRRETVTAHVRGLPHLLLHGLAHDVLPAAGFLVEEMPFPAEDVGEQAFGQPVLAHYPDSV